MFFTARIERPPLYRGGSASKKNGLPAPSHSSEAARSANTKPARHTLASSFVRFHVGPKKGVDPRLISMSLCLEPIQDLTIQANGYGGFRFGKPEHGVFEGGVA